LLSDLKIVVYALAIPEGTVFTGDPEFNRSLALAQRGYFENEADCCGPPGLAVPEQPESIAIHCLTIHARTDGIFEGNTAVYIVVNMKVEVQMFGRAAQLPGVAPTVYIHHPVVFFTQLQIGLHGVTGRQFI
jgi:hypothetical protein